MQPPSIRSHFGPILFWVVLQIPLGWLAAGIYLSSVHTLAHNGRWQSTKAALGKPPFGAQSYLEGHQALARDTLNLNAWHGHQEVVLRQPLDAEQVDLDLRLQKQAYFVVSFDRVPDGEFAAVRLSLARAFPSALLRVSPDGEFLAKHQIAAQELRLRVGEWHHLTLLIGLESTEVLLDGRRVATMALERKPGKLIGFLGSSRHVSIDNVVVHETDGSTFVERFDAPPFARVATAAAIAGLIALSAALFWALRHWTGRDSRTLSLYFAAATMSLLIATGAFRIYQEIRPPTYPKPTQWLLSAEELWRSQHASAVRERIRREHSPRPAPGTCRILVVGSSQTYGSGADQESDTFTSVLERMLNDEPGFSSRFECINAGVSGATAPILLPVYRQEWMQMDPDLVLINLSNNDIHVPRFRKALKRMVKIAQRQGVPVVLIQEANSIEHPALTLGKRHGAMRKLGEAHGVPVVLAHRRMREIYDEGFLWWDIVHPTVFGHHKLAEILHEEVIRLGAESCFSSP